MTGISSDMLTRTQLPTAIAARIAARQLADRGAGEAY